MSVNGELAALPESPEDSPAVTSFIDHVDVVISMHGHGLLNATINHRRCVRGAYGARR